MCKLIGVKDRNHSALLSQKVVGNTFHLIVTNCSLHFFFLFFLVYLIVAYTLFKEKIWSHTSNNIWTLH